MTTTAENALWVRQKQIVVQSFIDERKKLVSAVAGRGFLLAPGFLHEIETRLELTTKQKLSDVSYKILSDAVDRDLKQAGIDYDLTFKTYMIDWERDKQVLILAWDNELASLKQVQDMKEEELSQLAVEVSLRGAALLNAKTVIAVEMEELRGQLAALQDDSTDFEVALARQKILTAQRKLEVIPILQQILGIEQEILAKEGIITDKAGDVADAEKDKIKELAKLTDAHALIADKKEDDLLPVMQNLVTASEVLADATEDAMVFERAILAQKVLDAGILVQKAEKQLTVAMTQIEVETAKLSLLDARNALSGAQRNYNIELEKLEKTNVVTINTQEKLSRAAVLNAELATRSIVLSTKAEIAALELAQKQASSGILTANSIENINSAAESRYTAAVRSAESSAAATITASLTHLIG
jgi:hypothetical protein